MSDDYVNRLFSSGALDGKIEALQSQIKALLQLRAMDAAELEALRIYESMASEYGLSVFEDLRTLKVYAERYKWLRESDAPYLLVYAFCGDRDEVVTGHDLDRAIDEARKGAA